MTPPAARVLVVDDEAPIRRFLRVGLTTEGFGVLEAATGAQARAAVAREGPDLVLLDLGLPDIAGHVLLERWRAEGVTLPIVILSSRTDEAGIVQALETGADDYVTKPFGVLELLARIEALLRRTRVATQRTYRLGDVHIDADRRVVMRNGQPVALTPMELDLLLALLRRRGAVASRLELLQEVWGHSAAVLTRTVDTHVAELRRKLERDPAEPELILTARKAGYRVSAT